MEHSFDIDLAKKHGIEAAIIIRHLQFWVIKNSAERMMRVDGHTWCYASYAGIARQLPYLNAACVRYVIDKLVDDKILLKMCRKGEGRPNWWAFVDEAAFMVDDEGKRQEEGTDRDRSRPVRTDLSAQGDIAAKTEESKDLQGVDKIINPPADGVDKSIRGVDKIIRGVDKSINHIRNKINVIDEFKDTITENSNSDFSVQRQSRSNAPEAGSKFASLLALIRQGIDKPIAERIVAEHSYEEIMTVVANGLAKQRYDAAFTLQPGYLAAALKGGQVKLSKAARKIKAALEAPIKPLTDEQVQQRKVEMLRQAGTV